MLRDPDKQQARGTSLVATGRRRPLTTAQYGRCGRRWLMYRAEYRCLDCGHVGWSRHPTMERLLKQIERND